MSELFYLLNDFNEDLSNWDTSGVTDMSSMFYVRCLHLEPTYTLLEHSPLTITNVPSLRLGRTRGSSTSR